MDDCFCEFQQRLLDCTPLTFIEAHFAVTDIIDSYGDCDWQVENALAHTIRYSETAMDWQKRQLTLVPLQRGIVQ